MQLRGSKQAAVAGGAVIAALAMAACSSSSSSSSSSAPRVIRGVDRRGQRHVERGRGERHDQRGRLDVPDQLPAGRHLRRSSRCNPGITVNYDRVGSGTGRTDLYANTVLFAGSDSPIPASEQSKVPAGKTVLYFPVQIGPIAIAYNLSGVTDLKLDADRSSRSIFQGNDHDLERPGDQGAQPGRQPAEHLDHPRGPLGLLRHHGELLPVPGGRGGQRLDARHRLDHHVAVDRARRRTGGSGVAAVVKSTPGSIGYVDFSTATASGLTAASIKNSAGDYVAPSPAAATAAATHVTPKANLTFSAVDEPGATSYPITYQSLGPGVREAAQRQRRGAAQGLPRLPARRPASSCSPR